MNELEQWLEKYGRNPVLARSKTEIRNGDTSFDPVRRITRDRKLQRITNEARSATGGECTLIEALKPYPNANVYLRATPAQLASFVGARVRVYSVTDQLKTLEAQTIITSAPQAVQGFLAAKVRARGGVDSFVATLQLDPALPLPQGELDVELVSFECGGDEEDATPAPPGPVLFDRVWSAPVIAAQGVLSPGPASLMRVYGWTDPAIGAGLFLGFVDKAALVVNGDPFLVLPVPLSPGSPFSFDLEPTGIPFAKQIRFVMSSSATTVALVADAVAIQGERL